MKSELNELLHVYSMAVLTRNSKKRSVAVDNLHAYFNKKNVCVPSKLTTCYITFRGQAFNLHQFADFLRVPPILFLGIYEEYGSVIDMYLRYSGRPIIHDRNSIHDKEEFGNRFQIPWILLEQFEEDSPEYKFLFKSYTEYTRQTGTIGNMSLNTSSKSYADQPKVLKEFNTFLKKFEEPNKFHSEQPTRRKRGTGEIISATQAKLT